VGSHLLTGVVVVYHHIGISVLINAIAPREVRSTAQTLMVLVGSGLGPMLTNLGVGWIAAVTGQNLRAVFGFATVLAVLGGLLLILRAKKLNAAVAS
jgi:MFS family permease